MFTSYLELGFDHILDPEGYDHILFVVALAGIYLWDEWKEVLILVTAFTIGHSLTLALAALDIVQVNSDLVEFLIPITIIITCFFNIIKGTSQKRNVSWNYLIALSFGLIHGLGFSTYFKAILGKEESIVAPLLAFNIGVEFGQIIIVILALIISNIVVKKIGLSQKKWISILSVTIALWSLYLLLA